MGSGISRHVLEAENLLREHPAARQAALGADAHKLIVLALAIARAGLDTRTWACPLVEHVITVEEEEHVNATSNLARTLAGCLWLVEDAYSEPNAVMTERWLRTVADWKPAQAFVSAVRATLLLGHITESVAGHLYEDGFESSLEYVELDEWWAVVSALDNAAQGGVAEAHYNLAWLSGVSKFWQRGEHVLPAGLPPDATDEELLDYRTARLADAERLGMVQVLQRWHGRHGPVLPHDPLFLPETCPTSLP